jgi:actin-related protein
MGEGNLISNFNQSYISCLESLKVQGKNRSKTFLIENFTIHSVYYFAILLFIFFDVLKKRLLAVAASVGNGNSLCCVHKLSELNEATIRIKRGGRARPLHANSKSRQIACAKG